MADYSAEMAGAMEMLADAGAPIVFTRQANSGYDPVTDTYATEGPELSESMAVRVPPESEAYADTRQPRAAAQFIVAALGMAFPPEPGMKAEFAGDQWDVVSVEPLAPAGDPIIFTVSMEQ